MWAEELRPEALSNQIATDVHSPGKIRVNAVLSAMDQFYEVYGIEEGDGMYYPPEERPGIWVKTYGLKKYKRNRKKKIPVRRDGDFLFSELPDGNHIALFKCFFTVQSVDPGFLLSSSWKPKLSQRPIQGSRQTKGASMEEDQMPKLGKPSQVSSTYAYRRAALFLLL